MTWKIFNNVWVRGTLKACKIKGLPPSGDGGCLCITGTYDGDDSDPQAIADVVPVGYEIVSIHNCSGRSQNWD